jgi:hypothetical protein
MTKEELRSQWVAALRSGEYAQTRKQLIRRPRKRDGDDALVGYCCLGVAASICGFTDNQLVDMTEFVRPEYHPQDSTFDGLSDVLTELGNELSTIYSFRSTNGHIMRGQQFFTHLNDTLGWTFEQIADLVENQWDPIYAGA